MSELLYLLMSRILSAKEILSANGVVMLKASAMYGIIREQKGGVRKVSKNDNQVTHRYSTGSCYLDSDSEEDPEMASGNQATGAGSAMSALDDDKGNDLLSSSICHFEEEINKKCIGNNSYCN